MRVLLLGGGGFIGRQVLAALLAGGHEVVATVRGTDGVSAAFPGATFVAMDLARAVAPQNWAPVVAGVDVIVNAAGLLQGPALRAVHVAMPAALHQAARAAGVRRSILISAISARPDVDTDYARTKLEGEQVVRQSGLRWTILRPSLVYGDGSYGGTSLLRGLAGLPWLVPVPGGGAFPFTPIHIDDLAKAVRLACEDSRLEHCVLEPVGPDTLSLRQLLALYRRWLGFGPAWAVPIPIPVLRALAWAGDLAGDGPVSRTSLAQMVAGNSGDSAAFATTIGFQPRSLEQALRARPAQVQDRWHARLFFLAPAVRATLVLVWLASAMLGLWAAKATTAAFAAAAGLPPALADPLRVGTSVLDIGVAALVLLDRRGRWSTAVQVAVVLGYTIVLGLVLPGLWLDPLGPLLKNLPIAMLVLVHGAIADRR